MKVFLMVAGIIAVAAGLVGAVASFGPEESVEHTLKALSANSKGIVISGFLALAGTALVFMAGKMFGKGAEDFEPPEVCPDCDEEVARGTCPECGKTFGPPRYSLDTASLIGGVLALLLLGGMIGGALAKMDFKVLGALYISALCISGVSVIMGLCSLIVERRKVVLAVIGVVLSVATLGTAVFIIL